MDFALGTVTLGANQGVGSNSMYSVVVLPKNGAQVTPPDFPTFPGLEFPVQDLDGDGLTEDINGNGRFDFADIVVLFEQLDSPAVVDNQQYFDFNGNGSVDFTDIRDLFNLLIN